LASISQQALAACSIAEAIAVPAAGPVRLTLLTRRRYRAWSARFGEALERRLTRFQGIMPKTRAI
jgi:hypothetical protein